MIFLASYPSLQHWRIVVPGAAQVGEVDFIQALVCGDETSFLTKLHVVL